MEQSIAALIALLAQCISLLTLITPSPCAPSSVSFEMIPSVEYRYVKEGTFNITCRYTNTKYTGSIEDTTDDYIHWRLPIVLAEEHMRKKIAKHHHRQAAVGGPPFHITITSTLIVHNATSKETGLYGCEPIFSHAYVPVKRQHIYINNDEKSLVTWATYKTKPAFRDEASNGRAKWTGAERMEVDEASDVTIPCIATQRNVKVSLSHRTFADEDLEDEFLQHVPINTLVLEQSNSTDERLKYRDRNKLPINSKYVYLNQPNASTLIVRNARPSDSGIYKCSGSNGTTTSDINVLLIVKGFDVAMVGGNREIEEGSNVTLVCTTYNLTRLATAQPSWRYGSKWGGLYELLFPITSLVRRAADGQQQLKVKISHGLYKNEFYRSTLQLFNVTRQLVNNYFDCTDSPIRFLSSSNTAKRNPNREIAIRFKSKEKEVETIDMRTDEKVTLTCTKTEHHAVNFKWFKEKEPVSMTGQQPDANQLTLNGDPDDAGLYECRYEDQYGDERRRAFVVSKMTHISRITKNPIAIDGESNSNQPTPLANNITSSVVISTPPSATTLRHKRNEMNDLETVFIDSTDHNKTVMECCTTTENATDFQWFKLMSNKDKKPVNMTGQEYADRLTLNGDPYEDGIYQCRYVDQYGDERCRTFVVKIIKRALAIINTTPVAPVAAPVMKVSMRSKRKETDVETVIIETDINKNVTLMCTTTQHATNFTWFKNDRPMNMTGQEAADQLTLDGDPADDIGTYQCRYVDQYGDDRCRVFVVVAAQKISNNQTTHIAIVIAVSIVIFIAVTVIVVGLLWLFHNRVKKRKSFQDAEKLLNINGMNRVDDLDILSEDEAAAYAQQPYDKRWEFPRNRLIIGEQLGVGCFGRVLKCQAIGIRGSSESVTTVAVKTIKSRSMNAARELQSLVAELKILMYLGSHLNVVSLLGACTKDISKGDLMVILEYCPFGNLKSFLDDPNHEFDNGHNEKPITIRKPIRISWTDYLVPISAQQPSPITAITDEEGSTPASTNTKTDENDTRHFYDDVDAADDVCTALQTTPANSNKSTYSTRDLISWSWQIAKGMGHLANKKVVHGDLAARNVLLADNGVVKVADFGLANRLYYKEYYHKSGNVPLPVKWMAPESLMKGHFTGKSDVWSFGVVLWELFSLGKIPYPGIMGKQLVSELESGHRMDKPAHAPHFIGELMTLCWQREPTDRPTFRQLEGNLFKHLDSSVISS